MTNNVIRALLLLLVSFPLFFSQLASAQTSSSFSTSCLTASESARLKEKGKPSKDKVVTANTISQTGVTLPSLWWAKERLAPFEGKLIANWIANQDKKHINLVVNDQLWSLLDYIERYSFINEFGAVAREYNYNLSISTQQQDCLATYTCNFSTVPPRCEIDFRREDSDSLRM